MRKIKWTDTELAFHQNPVFEAMMNIQKNYNKPVEDMDKPCMHKICKWEYRECHDATHEYLGIKDN